MLNTSLGDIKISINDEIYNYTFKALQKNNRIFSVDERYKLFVNLNYEIDDIVIKCELINNFITGDVDSGEKLASIIFFNDKDQLSIGVEDERPNVNCEYLKNGLKVTILKEAKLTQIIFGVAWMSRRGEDEEFYTWYAADPTISDVIV